MNIKEIQGAIEALLFSNGEPLKPEKIASIISIEKETVIKLINNISDRYCDPCCGLQLFNLNGAYQICTKEQYAPYIKNLLEIRRNTPLSQPSLEVLAVIAYNQPVTKAFVEQVRGIDCSGIFSTLQKKKLIIEDGRLELPGRPILYKTTSTFLKCMNISSIDELPEPPKGKNLGNEEV